MKQLVAAASLFALLLAAGCGSSGSSKYSCADVASHINACITQLGGTPDSTIEAHCNAVTCTGDKQPAIDCIMALQCSGSTESEALACINQNGCTY